MSVEVCTATASPAGWSLTLTSDCQIDGLSLICGGNGLLILSLIRWWAVGCWRC